MGASDVFNYGVVGGKENRGRWRETERGPECEEVVVFSEEGRVPDHVYVASLCSDRASLCLPPPTLGIRDCTAAFEGV